MRAFDDGDFVFAFTEYDFSCRNIGFEVFRFEDSQTVEHWDNIRARLGPNQSDHSMVDGPPKAIDLDLMENNRTLVRFFIETVLVGSQIERLTEYVDEGGYVEQNPRLGDGATTLRQELENPAKGLRRVDYYHIHRILAEVISCFAPERANWAASIQPSTTSFGSLKENWWSLVTQQNRSHHKVNGKTIMVNFEPAVICVLRVVA